MTKKRRRFQPKEKVAILKRHLMNGEKVSDICDDIRIAPVLFYRWQKEFFDHGFKAFERDTTKHIKRVEDRMSTLQGELTQKNAVISELVQSYIAEKKRNGAT